jgi:hypothetical protein
VIQIDLEAVERPLVLHLQNKAQTLQTQSIMLFSISLVSVLSIQITYLYFFTNIPLACSDELQNAAQRSLLLKVQSQLDCSSCFVPDLDEDCGGWIRCNSNGEVTQM